MDDGTSIEIPQLMALGDDVAEVGARLARVAADIQGWRDLGSGAVEGSLTTGVRLRQFADDWHSTLGLLGRSIDDYGRSLHQAAADYRSTDTAAGERIVQAGLAAARIVESGAIQSGDGAPR